MLKEFPFLFEKGGVTAAGPLSISTRFPIKPKRAPRVLPYVKAPSDVKEKMVKKLSILQQKVDGLVKSPSTGLGRLSPGLGWGWNHLNSLQMAGEGQPSPAE